jgi:hypothetical protein
MLEPDRWDSVLSKVSGTVYRNTERISSNALPNLLQVGPDPVLRQRVGKRHSQPGPVLPLLQAWHATRHGGSRGWRCPRRGGRDDQVFPKHSCGDTEGSSTLVNRPGAKTSIV